MFFLKNCKTLAGLLFRGFERLLQLALLRLGRLQLRVELLGEELLLGEGSLDLDQLLLGRTVVGDGGSSRACSAELEQVGCLLLLGKLLLRCVQRLLGGGKLGLELGKLLVLGGKLDLQLLGGYGDRPIISSFSRIYN